MIQLLDPLDTATKPAELYIHNPTDLCEGQGFCISVVTDPAAAAGGVAPGTDLTGTGGISQNPAGTGTDTQQPGAAGAGGIPGQ